MTTTDEALTKQIARTMYYSDWPEERHRNGWAGEYNAMRADYLDRAEAVLPIIRKAQADAWQAGVNFALPSTETTHLARHNPHRAQEDA